MTNKEKMEKDEFFSLQEIAKILKLSYTTIYRYVKSGKIKTYKFGKDHRVRKEDFEKFIESKKNK